MSNLVLHCEPNTAPTFWSTFIQTAPDRSIALDGYVYGGPQFDQKRLLLNLNHHEEVDRLSTRCTAAQLAIRLRCGLSIAFAASDAPIHVYFNDCDQDVCLSIFMLRHMDMCRGVVNPILNRIVHIEDMLDTTAGSYGFFADMPGLEENNWIFNPYARAARNGVLSVRNPDEFLEVIDAVGERIMKTLVGKGEQKKLDPRYKVVAHFDDWRMVEETGLNARIGMYADGINAFVSTRSNGVGTYTYSIGRRSELVPFDVLKIIEALNAVEGRANHLWGGSNIIGGSPRATGSTLAPQEVARIVQDTIRKQ